MIGDQPTPKDNEPMTPDLLARTAAPIQPSVPANRAPHALPGRPVEGRRISFVAWGLAGLAGVAMWALILKLV